MENPNDESYYDKPDGIARWFGTSVAAAFFASLERFSCVNVNTYDSDDEDDEEAKDRPFILASYQSFNSRPSSVLAVNPIADLDGKNDPRSIENLPV